MQQLFCANNRVAGLAPQSGGKQCAAVERTPRCRAIELGRFGRAWEVLGSGQSPLQPVDALLLPATRRVMPDAHTQCRCNGRQCSQKLPNPLKISQNIPIKPPSILTPAYAAKGGTCRHAQCRCSWRHTIYRRGANAWMTRYGIGKIWEGLGRLGKRAKPAAAGRRSAPASDTPGNASRPRTMPLRFCGVLPPRTMLL